MGMRTWPVVGAALAGLLMLIVVTTVATRRKAEAIYSQLEQLTNHHREVDARLRRLRSDVHLSGIFIRDYLLDTSRQNAPEYRSRLADLRDNNMTTLAELRSLIGRDDARRVVGLQNRLEDYWEAFEPLFGWTVTQKVLQSPSFLRREVLPRRDAVMAIAEEIEALNNENLKSQREQIAVRQAEFRRFLDMVVWLSTGLGIIVAVCAVLRIHALERRSEEQHRRTEKTEQEMRRLSQQLVKTQEQDRKTLSRELHDHVGQMLTALRIELGRAERSRAPGNDGFASAIAECKHLTETMMRTVRDIALGLRPSMLDDFGLRPALEWHVRDFARRSGVPVDLTIEGDVDRLPDQHRTCIYRVVQEALTNCARHANATYITVSLCLDADHLDLAVVDNGVGLPSHSVGAGLGLIGLDERVRELGGRLRVEPRAVAGTALRGTIPVPVIEQEDAVANLVG